MQACKKLFLLSCLHSAAGYLDKCRGIKHHEGDGRTCLGCPGGAVLQYKAVAVGNGGRLVGTGTLKRDVTSLIIGCQSADGGNGVCAFTTIGDCITVVGGFNGKCRCVSRVSRCRSTDNIARILIVLVNACTCEGIGYITPVLVVFGLEGGEYHRTVIVAENVPLRIAHFLEKDDELESVVATTF